MTRLISISLLLALGAACGGLVDGDGDGATGTDDCDDKDAAVGPNATERCDGAGVDEDCDGLVNADDPSLDISTAIAAWPDADEDGFGDFMSSRTNLCALSAGFADNKDDCDDDDAAINPDAAEVCDDANVDENCNGQTTDAPTRTLWPDDDGDGYGDKDAASVQTCAAAPGLVDEHTDCDDTSTSIHPGADEVCDPADRDEDCDHTADNSDPSTAAATKVTVWADGDRDGYGAGVPIVSCEAVGGQASVDGDCDDSVAAVHPGAAEVCDDANRDEDCNGLADDNDAGVAPRSVYADSDGDGHGAIDAVALQRCDPGAGYATTHDDCDDTDPARAPGAQEVCDAANVDEDCDTLADDADTSTSTATKTTFYDDGDHDGYGELAVPVQRCDASSSASADSTDCNDNVAAIHPGAAEVCDAANTDEDCNGLADDSDAGVSPGAIYADHDGDGHGAIDAAAIPGCDAGAGYATTHDDCDDTDPARAPGAQEVCDAANVDEDCDTLADDADTSASTATKTTFYDDGDHDGYGELAVPVQRCDASDAASADHTDCNDNAAAIHPNADEVCDAANTDEDCDRTADNADSSTTDASKLTVWADGDRDGYGGGTPILTCDPAAGQVLVDGDCNDGTSAVHPGATEVCDNARRDEDCNGTSDDNDPGVSPGGMRSVYADGDGDGHAATNASAVQRCDVGAGFVSTRDDCDDTTAARAPGNLEVCDAANTDEDCDNLADDADSSASTATKTTFYDDGDHDGYGELAVTYQRCDASNSASADSTDCNDGDAAVHPGADELCDLYVGGRDEDCDGLKNDADPSTSQASMQGGYVDADGDGQGDENDVGTFACVLAGDYVDNNDDCDDTRPGILTSPMSGLCGASITDVNSPYYENVCDFSQYQTNPSNLIIDCRCSFNARVADECISPQTIRADHTIGAGPTMRGALGDTTIGGGGPDITTGEIIYAFNWDDGPNDEGMVWGVDYDTGDRRIISGRYLDARAGFVEYGTGPHLDHAVDLEVGPDGYYYLVSVAPNADEEIFKVDPATGNRTLAWRENDAAWAQCDNGANGPLQTVQVNSLGFEVGDDGSFYFGVFIFGGSGQGQGPSIIKISPDGQTCSYVTRYGAGSTNRFYGQNIGGGYPLSQGRYEGFEWVDGYLYAQDFVSQAIYRIDPVTGDRYVITSSTDHVGTGPAIGTRWVVYDPVRDLLWTSGLSPNPADIYSVDMTTGNRLDLTCFSPYLDSWDYCSEGPAATYAIQDSGIFVHPFTGDLIAGHTGYSFVKIEPDTGNSNTFSF